MNLNEYRTVFVAASLVLMLIVAAPTLSMIIAFPDGSEPFSELWLLGPTHMAEGFPFNVEVNETYSVFVGVGNSMGVSSYYLVYVKFRNQIQPLPDIQNSKPSPLMPLYEFRAFVVDDQTWEAPLTFTVLEVSHIDDFLTINRLSINGEIFEVNSPTIWDPEHKGFYYQLFCELWLHNTVSQSFQYHGRFVGIWLNVTVS
jgi:hypothetical protein